MNLTASPAHAWRVAFSLIGIDVKQGLRKHLAGSSTRGWLLKGVGLLFGMGFFGGLHFGAWALLRYARESASSGSNDLLLGHWRSGLGLPSFRHAERRLSARDCRAARAGRQQPAAKFAHLARAVLAARLFGNALQSCLVDGFIIVPYLNVLIFWFGQWQFLWGYAVWFALAVVVTCIDGLFSFGMIRAFGLRRARMLSQAVPFILIFAVTFSAGTLSVSIAKLNAASGSGVMPPEMQARFVALAHSPLVILSRASEGQALDLAGILIGTTLLAWATLRLTERAFVEGTQHVGENSSPPPSRREIRFRANALFLEVTKSIRLVMRTPMMVVQCLAQVLTPVGIAFVLGRDDVAAAAAFFVIFTSGVLSGMFTIAAGTVEEAEDLLQMSPKPIILFRAGKMIGACVLPFALACGAALVLLLSNHALDALIVLTAGLPLGAASSLVGETFATPVKPGQRPRLLSDPIMIIPLLGMQIISGLVAGALTFTVEYAPSFLGLGLLASYVIFAFAVGFATLRKPLF